MKKGLALILTLVLLVALVCTPAFAEREGVDDPTNNTNVNVNVTMDVSVEHKYFVDIEFPTDMTFTYSISQEWDPDTYSYVDTKDAPNGWSGTKEITITNHSDQPIKYSVSKVVTNDEYGDLGIELANGNGTIEACTVGTQDGSKNATFSIDVNGVPDEALKDKTVTLGQITIAITKV